MNVPRRPHVLISAIALLVTPLIAAGAEGSASNPPPAMLGSSVFDWNKLVVKYTPVGARRDVVDRPTVTLERFECHVTTLNPGLVSHPPHQHGQEEFIILREGTLDVGINGAIQRVGPGTMFFFAANDWHNVRNVGEAPATYLVFNFATAKSATAPKEGAAKTAAPGTLPSGVHEWEKLVRTDTRTGARRAIFDAPTVTFANLESHATTLNPGQSPHAAHRHPDEELIILKEGTLEVTIEGTAHRIGAGSIAFIGSNDEHALRNPGDVPATYYVVRVITEKTPKG